MKITDFTHPFTLYGPTGKVSLPKSDRCKIAKRTLLVALLTLGFGAPVAFYYFSHKARKAYKKNISQIPSSGTPINHVAQPILNGTASKPMHDLLSFNTPPEKRLPCDRADGMTCFFNTALQMIAHMPELRTLFDPSHKLTKSPDETEEDFCERQEIQRLTNHILYDILSGQNKAHGLGELVRLAHKFHYKAKEVSQDTKSIEERLRGAGGDGHTSFRWLLDPMKIDNSLIPRPAVNVEKLDRMIVLPTVKPKMICLQSTDDLDKHSSGPQLELDFRENHYQLEAVIATTGRNGHVIPFLKSGDTFVLLDDVQQAPRLFSKKELCDYAGSIKKCEYLYKMTTG